MLGEENRPTNGASASNSNCKPRKKKSIKRVCKGQGSFNPEEAEKLLQQHCRGLWSESEEDVTSSTNSPLQEAVGADGEGEMHQVESEDGLSTLPSQVVAKAQRRKRKKRVSAGVEVAAFVPPSAPADPSTGQSVQVQQQHVSSLVSAGADENMRSHLLRKERIQGEKEPSKRQAKNMRKWRSMRSRAASTSTPSALLASSGKAADAACTPQTPGNTSKSFQMLKELGGLASPSAAKRGHDGAIEWCSTQPGQERKEFRDSQKEFDETVHEIRNLVYPHLGRFQRRQFVTTALRALGIPSAKMQKMPLPEFQSRKKATARALEARRAEAKALGVSSHIDSQGSVQQAARNRLKLTAQKQRRKHLRDTFKHAGKYTNKGPRSFPS